MDPWTQMVVTVFCSVAASSGFWAFLAHKADKKDAKTRMILGLGHDRLVFLCLTYLNRGKITKEEYENLYKYLYEPYQELGGNGTVAVMMEQIKKLPITGSIHFHNPEEETI